MFFGWFRLLWRTSQSFFNELNWGISMVDKPGNQIHPTPIKWEVRKITATHQAKPTKQANPYQRNPTKTKPTKPTGYHTAELQRWQNPRPWQETSGQAGAEARPIGSFQTAKRQQTNFLHSELILVTEKMSCHPATTPPAASFLFFGVLSSWRCRWLTWGEFTTGQVHSIACMMRSHALQWLHWWRWSMVAVCDSANWFTASCSCRKSMGSSQHTDPPWPNIENMNKWRNTLLWSSQGNTMKATLGSDSI